MWFPYDSRYCIAHNVDSYCVQTIVVNTTFSQAVHSRVNRMTALILLNGVSCPSPG